MYTIFIFKNPVPSIVINVVESLWLIDVGDILVIVGVAGIDGVGTVKGNPVNIFCKIISEKFSITLKLILVYCWISICSTTTKFDGKYIVISVFV